MQGFGDGLGVVSAGDLPAVWIKDGISAEFVSGSPARLGREKEADDGREEEEDKAEAQLDEDGAKAAPQRQPDEESHPLYAYHNR